MFRLSAATFCCALSLSIFSTSIRAQTQSTDNTIHVTVAIGADGSRTTYESDRANHKATATTSGPDGKLRQKIQFELDEAGHYKSSQAFGPEGEFRFKALYKYDAAGRITEEKQFNKDDSLQRRIIYTFDQLGKATGLSIYDAKGKLISHTGAPTTTASPSPANKKAKLPGSR
jgi:hypothetical protein